MWRMWQSFKKPVELKYHEQTHTGKGGIYYLFPDIIVTTLRGK